MKLVSLRLDRKTASRLDALSATTGRTRSHMVREAIAAYEAEPRGASTAHVRLSSWIGCVSSAGTRPAVDRRTAVKTIFEDKALARGRAR